MIRQATAMVVALCALPAREAPAQSAPRLKLIEELKIDGAKEDISGIAPALVVARNGVIAIMNPSAGHFVFFDSAGKRIGTFGAKGAGPGEFTAALQNIYSMEIGTIGDSIWVEDERRYTIIGPDRRLVRTMQEPPRHASMTRFSAISLLPGDRILGSAKFGRGDRVAMHYVPDTVVIVARDGSVERRVAPIAPDSSVMLVQRGGRIASRMVPMVQRPSTSASPDGQLVATLSTSGISANGGTFHLSVYRTSGALVFTRSYPYSAAPVTKRVADSVIQALHRPNQDPEDARAIERVRERLPASMSPFAGSEIANDGTVWLSRESYGKARELLAISATGEIIGSAILPRPQMYLRAATRNTLWAQETDADGFVSIVRFRVGH